MEGVFDSREEIDEWIGVGGKEAEEKKKKELGNILAI